MSKTKRGKSKLAKGENKKGVSDLKLSLGEMQRRVHSARIPVIIVFEGLDAASMVTSINRTLLPLDPRGFSYYSIGKPDETEQQMPFMWRFWMRTPEKGRIAIFDRSWYSQAVSDCLGDGTCEALPGKTVEEILRFEKLLSDDGAVIIKLLLRSARKNAVPRLKAIDLEACGLVQDDLDIAHYYRENLPFVEDMVHRTDVPYAPWTTVDSDDDEYAEVTILRAIIESIGKRLEESSPYSEGSPVETKYISRRSEADLDVKVSDNVYKAQLSRHQAKLRGLQCELHQQKKRLVVVFEGRDASGKGGDINRVTQALNPRTYEVVPITAPSDIELAHHYLWRFYRHIPLPGHIAIFDRSWYGRVLVERVNGITTQRVWERSYREINDFERMLVDNDCILVKLWLEVSKDVQLKRFIERVEDPRKMWKITQDDWEARELWDQYTEAVDEMLQRTSTAEAPWTVVESNDKNHSRIKTLKTIIDGIEKAL